MPTVCLKHIREDAPRRNRIHRNTFRSTVLGKAAREAFDGGFGARVQGMVTHAGHAGRHRGREDDAAPVAAMFQAVLGDEELAAGVEVEDLVVVPLRHILFPLEGLHARVRHDDVDAAEVSDGLLEEGVDLGRVGNVGLDGNRTRAQREEIRDHLIRGLRGSAVVYRDAGTSGTELEGDAGTQAAARACDEGNSTVEAAMGPRLSVCLLVLHV